MFKFNFNLRNTVKTVAVLAATTVFFASCEKEEPNGGGEIPTGTLTELTSPITQNTTLKDLGLAIDYVYKGSSLLEVKNNAILTIEPGVTIQFTQTGGGMEIKDGATVKAVGLPKLLDAQGNVVTVGGVELDGHIQFVGASATKGSWNSIKVRTVTDNQFTYVDFLNGGSNKDATTEGAVLYLNNAKAGISHCKISGSLVHGITMYDDCNIAAFDNNVVENIDKAPVWMRGILSKLAKFDMTSDFTNNTNRYIQVSPPQFNREDVALNKTSVPYYFTSSIDLADSKRLTINEGVTVYMGNSNVYITDHNGGALTINGTAEKPVTLTRLPGSSYYWYYLGFEHTGNVINNCILEYGGGSTATQNYDDAIILIDQHSELSMNNVVIRNSYGYGVVIDEYGSSYRLTHSGVTFAENYKGDVLMMRSKEVLTQLP